MALNFKIIKEYNCKMVEARTCGKIYFISIIVSWVYYSIWMLITPLIDADHPI